MAVVFIRRLSVFCGHCWPTPYLPSGVIARFFVLGGFLLALLSQKLIKTSRAVSFDSAGENPVSSEHPVSSDRCYMLIISWNLLRVNHDQPYIYPYRRFGAAYLGDETSVAVIRPGQLGFTGHLRNQSAGTNLVLTSMAVLVLVAARCTSLA